MSATWMPLTLLNAVVATEAKEGEVEIVHVGVTVTTSAILTPLAILDRAAEADA
jgi:hypothetical protein